MDQVQPSISTFSEVESTKFNSVSYRAEPELSIKPRKKKVFAGLFERASKNLQSNFLVSRKL